MGKIVYNNCYGGFGLSDEALEEYAKRKGIAADDVDVYSISRTDPDLVAVVELLGDDASNRFAELRIAELPSGTLYRIDEYDGNESVTAREAYDWSVVP
jgi:hypothetical protein